MKKTSFASTLAIMSVCFIASTMGSANPIIQKMIEAYPDISVTTVRLVSTLPSAAGMIVALIVGTVAGRKVKFKTICAFGAICYILGGIAPAFVNSSFSYVLIARFIFGIGIGCFGCRNALILRSFDSAAAAKMLGMGVMVANCGCIVFQMITGFLGDISWNLGFYPYFLAIITLVMVMLIMQEPEKAEAPAKSENPSVSKAGLGARTYIFALIVLLSTLWLYPLLTGMSTFLKMKGLGTAGVAGTILSLYTVGGAFGGFILGKMNKLLGRYMIIYALGIVVLGQAMVLYCNSIFLIGLGTTICGIGYMSITPTLTSYLNGCVPKHLLGLSSSIIIAAVQAGVFLSSFWISFVNTAMASVMNSDIERTFLAAIIAFGLLVVIFLIVDPRPEQLRAPKENK